MSNYRPICDRWLLVRTKLKGGIKFYGSYPGGFLERARALLGVHITDPVLHVCAGRVRNYPYGRGFGPNDMTLDLDPETGPTFVRDARDQFPACMYFGDGRWTGYWPAILMDPPYTDEHQEHYAPVVHGKRPTAAVLLKNALAAVRPGGRVGLLHFSKPRPPKGVVLVASIAVCVGYGNQERVYSVYEKPFTTEANGSIIEDEHEREPREDDSGFIPEAQAGQDVAQQAAADSGSRGTGAIVYSKQARHDEAEAAEEAAEVQRPVPGEGGDGASGSAAAAEWDWPSGDDNTDAGGHDR